MSLQTWKAEFYPIEAEDVPKVDALAHSLRKWEGLLPENLKRHAVYLEYANVRDQNENFPIDASTCALCIYYSNWPVCQKCPIWEQNQNRCDESSSSVYTLFEANDDPNPMIQLLRKLSNQTPL